MNAKSIVIRRAVREDAESIWQVRTRAIRELCSESYSDADIAAWASSRMTPSFAEVICNTEFFVAESDSHIIGHAFLDQATGEIAAVFVSPNHVRRGVGSRLLRCLEERARAIGLASVWLSATLNAVGFYSSAGYDELGPSEFPHPDGFALACVKMIKALG